MARGPSKSPSAIQNAPLNRDESEDIMFGDEDFKNLQKTYGVRRGPNYLEVNCGCTSTTYGDMGGNLQISSTGQFIITCQCSPVCNQEGVLEERGKLTPPEFEKHARIDKEGRRHWKDMIWIINRIDGLKVPLGKSEIFKYYMHASNHYEGKQGSCTRGRRSFHRDEFLRCAKCNRERRFHQQNGKELRDFHDAAMNKRWQCADHPNKVTCDDDEERGSRKSCRGCRLRSNCKGCISCVCLGCPDCRFQDCNCRTCVDYIQNVKP